MEKAYLDIAMKVDIPGWRDPQCNKFELVKTWFEDEKSGKWLIIIDNADDLDLLYGSGQNRMAKHFPRSNNGSILLTTRNKRVGIEFATASKLITVQALTATESESLLSARLGAGNKLDAGDLRVLAEVLADIPLALVQAAAYISKHTISVKEYIQLYHESDKLKIQLLSTDFEDDMRDLDMKNPIATTWAVSFEYIQRHNSLAADILSIMSIFQSQAIPEFLLPFEFNTKLFKEALGTLQAFSLITLREPARMNQALTNSKIQKCRFFDLHRLVRLATRNWLSLNMKLNYWTAKALKTLSERLPADDYLDREDFPENQETFAACLPHALEVLSNDSLKLRDNAMCRPVPTVLLSQYLAGKHADEGVICAQCTATLMHKLSAGYITNGDSRAAETFIQGALAIRERVIGDRHLDTLKSMSNLAYAYRSQGRYVEAEKLDTHLLNIRKEILGNTHPDTLTSIANLAWTYHKQRRYDEAEKLGQQALEAQRKARGDNHPDTLKTMSNLAYTYCDKGQYNEAEKLDMLVLKARERFLGETHPYTLRDMENLSWIYGKQTRYREAKELGIKTLKIRSKILGERHPDTLTSMANLACIYDGRSQHDEAEALNARVLELRKEVLGERHLDTLTSMANLACTYNGRSQHDEAEALNVRVLELQTEVLGERHPDTLTSMANLAYTYGKQGRHDEAEALEVRALELRTEVLGERHLDTLTSVINLAYTYGKQGRHDEAEALKVRALELRTEVSGERHPDTLKSMANLAGVYDGRS
jgi:tetratricopeptide (TPR) repeat protein